MPTVRFTKHLGRFFPGLGVLEIDGATVRDVVDAIDLIHPGLRGYIVDDAGVLRKHVNIFVDGTMVRDRVELSDLVGPNSELDIMQALSGG